MMVRVRSLAVAVCVLSFLGVARPARAEEPAPAASPEDATIAALALALAVAPVPAEAAWPDGAPAGMPEVEVYATVTASSLVFDRLPRIRLAFGGAGPRRAVWRIDRVNLPARVEPGVVYHDVEVRLTLASTADELESLLADARTAARGIRLEPVMRAAAPAPAAPAASAAPAAALVTSEPAAAMAR